MEAELECVNDFEDWKGKKRSKPTTEVVQVVPVSGGVAQQCKGVAKSTGQRCKTRTTNANGYCNAHQNQAPK